jgi:hypothetical protein
MDSSCEQRIRNLYLAKIAFGPACTGMKVVPIIRLKVAYRPIYRLVEHRVLVVRRKPCCTHFSRRLKRRNLSDLRRNSLVQSIQIV